MRTSTQQGDPIVVPAPAAEGWQVLYLTGAAAALISAVLIPIQVAVFLVWPPPIDGTVADWFALLHDHRLAGLVDLDLLLVADNVLLIPILLALYVALRRAYPSVVLIAVALGFVGVAMYLASNPAVQMAALSDQYATALVRADRPTAVPIRSRDHRQPEPGPHGPAGVGPGARHIARRWTSRLTTSFAPM